MTLREYSSTSRLALKVLFFIKKRKVISDPLTDEDVLFLQKFERLWCSDGLLKSQLAKLGIARSLRLIYTAKYNPWESHCYSRAKNLLEQVGSVSEVELCDEISEIFKIKTTESVKKRVRSLVDKCRYRHNNDLEN